MTPGDKVNWHAYEFDGTTPTEYNQPYRFLCCVPAASAGEALHKAKRVKWKLQRQAGLIGAGVRQERVVVIPSAWVSVGRYEIDVKWWESHGSPVRALMLHEADAERQRERWGVGGTEWQSRAVIGMVKP